MKNSTRNQLAVDVQARLNNGENKSAIYNALKADYPASSVERSLAQWPIPEAKEKNKHFNYTLLILATFFTLLKLLQTVPFLQPGRFVALPLLALPIILYAYVIYGIKNYNLIGYLLLILLSIKSIINFVQTGIRTPNAVMLVALSAAAIVLSILQKKRLFPNTSWFLRHKRDDNGTPIF